MNNKKLPSSQTSSDVVAESAQLARSARTEDTTSSNSGLSSESAKTTTNKVEHRVPHGHDDKDGEADPKAVVGAHAPGAMSSSERTTGTHQTTSNNADGYATTTGAQERSDEEMEEARQIAEKETHMVRRWRFITADVLIMTFSTVVLTSYAILRSSERQEFEEQYSAQAEYLATSLTKFFAQNAIALTALASSISSASSSAVAKGYRPNSTTSIFQPPADFQARVDLIQSLSSIESLWYAPLMTHQEDQTILANLSFVDGLVVQDLTLLGSNNNKTLQLLPPPSSNENSSTYSYMVSPIFLDQLQEEEVHNDKEVVGLLAGGFSLQNALLTTLETHIEELVLVVQCPVPVGGSHHSAATRTYHIESSSNNNNITQSIGDQHDVTYNDYQVQVNPMQCHISIYPTRDLELAYRTIFPEIFTLVLAFAFLCVSFAFFKYDILVDRRNEKLIDKFARSNAIVSSLFPKMFRDRLLGNDDAKDNVVVNNQSNRGGVSISSFGFSSSGGGKLKNLMMRDSSQAPTTNPPSDPSKTSSLADLFPEVSILFADIAGFTAWSSSREPHQVFTLLESLYSAFDAIAKRRRIFKVETIGDCYVAASGMPEPRMDHALAIVMFASDILAQMNVLVRSLEVTLGPDTADLALRCGIHSGAVTAGILRGQKARFQLFGDTMNVASRMESNGRPRQIQVSQATASILIKSGHENWLEKRAEKIAAKGKGLMQTYWVVHSSPKTNSETSSTLGSDLPSSDSGGSGDASQIQRSCSLASLGTSSNHRKYSIKTTENDDARIRLIEWNSETLLAMIRRVVAHRQAHSEVTNTKERDSSDPSSPDSEESGANSTTLMGQTPLEEVQEIIRLPEFHRATKPMKPAEVRIPKRVVAQLRLFVKTIASMYNDNDFHDFSHASHVVMSVTKLMSRIVAPPHLDCDGNADEALLHDHTYGITSDPLTQLACAFSGLIHDVDHRGVSNAQLVKESVPIANKYHARSVAEQHSLDVSLKVFMSSDYDDLRNYIFANEVEQKHFRSLLVNLVMATDISDKELGAKRKERWAKAFAATPGEKLNESHQDSVNRKATIVLEHLIQASDVAHTMQHWHIYRKWNEKLLREVYKAYKAGRAERDPLDLWYQGELGFFDYYVIPLAMKLKECGVFGVSCDEYLNYARNNREEWEQRGEQVVAEMAEKLREEYKQCWC